MLNHFHKLKQNGIYRIYTDARTILNPNERKKYRLLIITGAFLNLMDLLGLLLVVSLISLSSQKITTVNKNDFTDKIINKLNLNAQPTENLIFWISLMTVTLFLLKTVLSILVSKKTLVFLSNVSLKLSYETLKNYLNQTGKPNKEYYTGEMVYSLSLGIPRIIFVILGSASVMISDLTLLLLMIISLILFDLQTTLIVATIFGIFFLISHKYSSDKSHELGIISNKNNILANDLILNCSRNRKEIYVKGNTQILVEIYKEKRQKHLESTSQQIFLQGISRYFIEIVIPTCAFVLVVFNFFWEFNFQKSLSLGLFLVAGARIAPALIKIQSNLLAIKATGGEVQEVHMFMKSLLRNESTTNDSTKIEEKLPFNPILEFRNVNFKYNFNDNFALKNINLKIEKGEIIALTGPSGSGKSTILDLSIGLLKADSGSILLSGLEPRTAIQLHPGKIGYVPQDAMIIGGSIKENLILGNLNTQLNDPDFYIALERANLREFVESLDNKLETQVGEFGILLSGGQRQRLGLARALVSHPELIFLDEITSALDVFSENEMKELIVKMKHKTTFVIVSHSENFIEIADRILRIQNGEIIEIK